MFDNNCLETVERYKNFCEAKVELETSIKSNVLIYLSKYLK